MPATCKILYLNPGDDAARDAAGRSASAARDGGERPTKSNETPRRSVSAMPAADPNATIVSYWRRSTGRWKRWIHSRSSCRCA